MPKKHKCKECGRWEKTTRQVFERNEALGFKHNEDKAKAAMEILNKMGLYAQDRKPHTVTQVAGLTKAEESW